MTRYSRWEHQFCPANSMSKLLIETGISSCFPVACFTYLQRPAAASSYFSLSGQDVVPLCKHQ